MLFFFFKKDCKTSRSALEWCRKGHYRVSVANTVWARATSATCWQQSQGTALAHQEGSGKSAFETFLYLGGFVTRHARVETQSWHHRPLPSLSCQALKERLPSKASIRNQVFPPRFSFQKGLGLLKMSRVIQLKGLKFGSVASN